MAKVVDAIPVMYSLYGNKKGPWNLGWIHPKYKEVARQYDVPYQGREYPTIPVYDMFNGIPAYPKKITLLEDFKAPDWEPDWNWAAQCN